MQLETAAWPERAIGIELEKATLRLLWSVDLVVLLICVNESRALLPRSHVILSICRCRLHVFRLLRLVLRQISF